ncbi:virion assembly protein [Cotia virus SPAn232]|uniref:Virion assembly protein n=2 Tax=Cotia virus TaxID=39444 RepID=H6TA57_9POXV|nr:virion assembly protein [Cotia virus SPAn232]ADT91097.1 virion assembly protein [Cotia virus SPAn232]AIT70696.1 virion assembly protein [Cotia virus]
MDHIKYILTIFLENDDSFIKYLSEQDDETTISDIENVTSYLNFLLMILIQSKDKLESIGYYYEPLSEKFNTLVDFSNMKTFRTLYNRIPINVSKSSININKGNLSDFVTTLIRLKKDYNVNIPETTTYIDPREDIRFNNILSILNKNE